MKNRRVFIKQSGSALIGAGMMISNNPFAIGKSLASSDQVNVALIGCNSMGFNVLRQHLKQDGVKCVALCDVDENVLLNKSEDIKKNYGQKPKLFKDFRKIIDHKDIDIVIIGTPDHWHCLPMVYACEMGKSVYVEKPMANSIGECNLMSKAAERYNSIVQVGQQQRSGAHWAEIMQMIHSGQLGKLRKVETWANFNYGIGAKITPDVAIPAGVDYNFWLGPAPIRKTFNTGRYHGKWRMWWDYGGGLMTDFGAHLIDMALWAGRVKADPKEILSYGRNLSFKDYGHETYDTMSVSFPQDDYIITWESTAGTQNGPCGKNFGVRFICDNASIVADRQGYKLKGEWDSEVEALKVGHREVEGRSNHDLHAKNLIECVRANSRNTACPPEIGRQVATYVHSANIAARTGEYLLKWDGESKRFTNSEKANALVMPEYRQPWVLPNI